MELITNVWVDCNIPTKYIKRDGPHLSENGHLQSAQMDDQLIILTKVRAFACEALPPFPKFAII